MRHAKSARIMLPLAMAAVLAASSFAQEHPNVQPNSVRELLATQGSQGSPAPSAPAAPQDQKPAPKPSSPSKPPAKAPATPAAKAPAAATTPAAAEAKAPAKTPQKTASKAKAAAKSAAKPAPAGKEKEIVKAAPATPAKPPVEKPAEEKASGPKRDPFDTLLTRASTGNASPENLPPGKAGLVVGTLRIDGIVSSPSGMIAIVSNPQQRVYFLREGDKLYDGSVAKISLEAVSFHEFGKDAFGKPLERIVAKRLYPSPGESGEQR